MFGRGNFLDKHCKMILFKLGRVGRKEGKCEQKEEFTAPHLLYACCMISCGAGIRSDGLVQGGNVKVQESASSYSFVTHAPPYVSPMEGKLCATEASRQPI